MNSRIQNPFSQNRMPIRKAVIIKMIDDYVSGNSHKAIAFVSLGQLRYSIARNEPVIVEKTGRKVIVLIAFEEYERLTQIEDAYWAEKAARAETDGYVGEEQSMAFIRAKRA